MNPENIQISLDLVRRFLSLAQARNPDRIELVGTEVFRCARNVDEFRDHLPEPLSLSDHEAGGGGRRLLPGRMLGAPQGAAPIGQLVVIDLGGGSLEVVGGLQGRSPLPLASVSMGAIGTLSLREAWMRGAKMPGPGAELRRYIDAEIARHADELSAFRAPGGGEPSGPSKLLVAGLGFDRDRLGLGAEREVAQPVQVEGGQWPHRIAPQPPGLARRTS